MADVELSNIDKSYGSFVALKNIDLKIISGNFFTLLGPSGCGKTTLLRVIAGFHRQDRGDVKVASVSISNVPANKRDVGMVFQDYAIFPHLSVFENVAFGLKQRKIKSAEIKSRVAEILKIVHLGGSEQKMPHELSGGQQQRVGLARALVVRPKVLLMDEPLSNLDAKLRVDLRADIRAIQKEFGITTIYVTHDQEEALAISDKICVMNQGDVQQVANPWDIYHRSQNRFVASFVGANNFLPVTFQDNRSYVCGELIELPQKGQSSNDTPPVAAVRPEQIKVAPAGTLSSDSSICIPVKQLRSSFTGREITLSTSWEDSCPVEVIVPAEVGAARDIVQQDRLVLEVPRDAFHFYLGGEMGERID